MRGSELDFARPQELQARAPPEARGLARDGVRLMVSEGLRTSHLAFRDLPGQLRAGDLLVVNRSATVPASLPARGPQGPLLLNISTGFGDDLWLVEPRPSSELPGPFPWPGGTRLMAGDARVTLVAPLANVPRIWFARSDRDLRATMARFGSPIRYGYVRDTWPLADYQTLFGTEPGSAEMPSAGRPFTPRVVRALKDRGLGLAGVTLHCGVSSLELGPGPLGAQTLLPEPFCVPTATARAVNRARRNGRRVLAVGTTVVRALETAFWAGEVHPVRGFTRLFVRPRERPVHVVDGLLTGLHDPSSSHLAMLYALAGPRAVRRAYREAVDRGYLWHEFGDLHLLLRGQAS